VHALTDQIAVVTGAGSGIGKAIALGLAREGATICLVGRTLEKLKTVAGLADGFPDRISIYQTDLEMDDDVQALASDLQKEFGDIDILVHSAGVISMGTIEQSFIEDFDWQYRINVRAPYRLTQTLLPMLIPRQGQIAFVNSTSGLIAREGLAQYAATKHALKAIADSLRAEVNERGVRVISVYPGRTATPMQANIYATEGKTYKPEILMQPEDVSRIVIEALKVTKTTEVTDIILRPARKH
jgi:NADP-dependent 3-hydroxy acid dehydrogenase YdfG